MKKLQKSAIRRRLYRSKNPKGPVKKVMKFRQSLFWDVEPKSIDPEKHKRYIIERILDFGNDQEVHWMWHYYGKKLIADVVKKSRVLHGPTRSLWTLLVK